MKLFSSIKEKLINQKTKYDKRKEGELLFFKGVGLGEITDKDIIQGYKNAERRFYVTEKKKVELKQDLDIQKTRTDIAKEKGKQSKLQPQQSSNEFFEKHQERMNKMLGGK